MIKYENQCIGCPSEMGCLGSGCKYLNVPVYYCDTCGDECGECYEMDDENYCEDCAKQYLRDCFDDLSLNEQAEILDINMKGVE